jgi:hypothetical protein
MWIKLHLLLKQQSYHPEDLLEIAKWYQGDRGESEKGPTPCRFSHKDSQFT